MTAEYPNIPHTFMAFQDEKPAQSAEVQKLILLKKLLSKTYLI
jgi:hypothetical protein